MFAANFYLAHAIDYLLRIRSADAGSLQPRGAFVKKFDELFSVPGGRFQNCKFELIDAINNSLKHIELDAHRYTALLERYGAMSFRNLVEEEGLVLCLLSGYRFDYARVVLRPAYRALSGWDLDSSEDILEFARGDFAIDDWKAVDELMASDDPSDAIDQMIAHCNPSCDDCGQQEEACRCAEFVYEGEGGSFHSRFRADFDFDLVMSRISGAYRPGD
ncbi:MAG: hypothetical protein DI587_11005 [Variovorax paradoxus]|nr:MAG: hypothetical protein DI583_11005 [Variovorax paradoxus]PZQ10981.1 MAG: hypothetical protein DI587_11005 [Variovorax paradoxus]